MYEIKIDLSVNRAIEIARTDYSETQNAILRRLLKIEESSTSDTNSGSALETENIQAPGKCSESSDRRYPLDKKSSWRKRDVCLPHGTKLRIAYNGVEVMGEIRDGKWIIDGIEEKFNSPTPAAAAVALFKLNKKVSLDGWRYWEAKLPEETDWRKLLDLRPISTKRKSH